MAPLLETRTASPSERDMLSLHRYFMWTGHMRFRFFERLAAATKLEEYQHTHFIDPYLPYWEPYLPYWCAGTYVLVEGWRRLALTNPLVDSLLDAKQLRLLEKCRNGVYHFHPEYYDEKFRDFWAEARGIHEWLDELWTAFDIFFREWMTSRSSRAEDTPRRADGTASQLTPSASEPGHTPGLTG